MKELEKNPEAVEIFDLSKLTIGQASMLAQSVFKCINVNNCTLACYSNSSDEAFADLLNRIKKHALMCMIQDSFDEHMKLTFVTSIPWRVFLKLLYRQRDLCEKIYKCKIFVFED